MNSHFAQQAEKEASLAEDEPPSRETTIHAHDTTSEKPTKRSLKDTLSHAFRRLPFIRTGPTLKEALEEVLEEHEETSDALATEERIMLENVLAFGDITVGDIVIPRTDIIAVAADISLDDLKRFFIEERHTRVPVYHDNLDHIDGFVHIKDIFSVVATDQPFALKDMLRPMLFVPPSMPVADLLVRMRKLSSHMAIVVDEYGGTDGLVTLEDVFEEIVGDIQDEHDLEDQHSEVTRISESVADVDARIRLDQLAEELNIHINAEENTKDLTYETLAGWVFTELSRIPDVGERIHHPSGVMFEITEADGRRIFKIRIHHMD